MLFSGFIQKAENNILTSNEFFSEVYENKRNVHLFDLRIESEYIKSRLIDAVLADTKEKFSEYLKKIDKEAVIFIYCEEGQRTKAAAEWLYTLGYKDVYQLKGGFNQWRKNGYPIDAEKIK
ncbi:rhodanese-like domain-containing protein [Plebeiibacterium marinum]|uniref:Rhodanese-like domain-containing protein n=1 Tax=Plebeiibacterium marinum TaxID=2992111 RepID=A0AAE3MFQ6_9BACT|nr:rhodanese-like domain-containing protein [Plebeiobacterium marinum]MCW3806989.1 rhodanese-like domain-containing protein [Plebeiobacterium marinum]